MIDAIVVAMLVYRLLPTVQEPFPDGPATSLPMWTPKQSHLILCVAHLQDFAEKQHARIAL